VAMCIQISAGVLNPMRTVPSNDDLCGVYRGRHYIILKYGFKMQEKKIILKLLEKNFILKRSNKSSVLIFELRTIASNLYLNYVQLHQTYI
jgi:hypothetical protein